MFKIKINEKQFKNLFKVFSLILLIDYPILPFVVSIIKGDIGCEGYDVAICISASLIFVILIVIFWCVAWFMSYIVFFMEDRRNKSSWKFAPLQLYIKYVQNAYKGKIIQETVLKIILITLCCGVLYLFVRELYNFFNV